MVIVVCTFLLRRASRSVCKKLRVSHIICRFPVNVRSFFDRHRSLRMNPPEEEFFR